ncbi:hypothetical protein DFH11DRAFT_48603 [Phellopilus nigrolimitatus]|nr:hypothetical protein DFH11DRAFT_48603 [Phellopilus nigrolimitatus]
MQPSSHLTRTLDGVQTEVVILHYADRVLVLVTQMGKVGNLIQASIPPTAPLLPLLPATDDVPLVEPPPSIELTPLLGSAPSQYLATLHSLYASHISTLLWTLTAEDGGERRSVVVGLALKRTHVDDGSHTFKGVMKMIVELLRGDM